MIVRKYQCNLCRADKDLERLTGLHWQGPYTGGGWVQANPKEVENHICDDCLRSVAAIAAKPQEQAR